MGHTYSNILIHAVFSTKDRRPIILPEFEGRLWQYLCGLARKEFGVALRVGGTENHIHALLSLRTDASVAEAMRKWKSLSSGWLHKTVPAAAEFAWQVGYGAFSVSQSNVDAVVNYIANQKEHHRHKTFEEEFIAFLERHGVKYDPKHVWD